MNKTVIIVIALVVLLGGCYWIYSNNKVSNVETVSTESTVVDFTPETTVTTPTPAPAVKPVTKSTTPAPVSKTGTILKYNSVAAAMSSGKSMKCTDSTGPVTDYYYISGPNVRNEHVTSIRTTYLVITSSSVFSWYKGTTQETDYAGQQALDERSRLVNTSLLNVPCTATTVPSSYFARP